MNKIRPFRSFVLAAAFAASVLPAFAYWTPLQVNLVDVVGLPPAADDVYGIRANLIYGRCDTVAGIDLGLDNHTLADVYGIRAGVFNFSEGSGRGISVALVNSDEHNLGLTAGGFNLMRDAEGLSVGILNGANTFSGVQIGLFNLAFRELSGVQIGLLNFNLANGFPVFPFVNLGFGPKE